MQRILVPLDGSALAEAVLEPVLVLASQASATVVLLHVIEHRAPAKVHGDRHLTVPLEADSYLDKVADRLRAAGAAVETHVHEAPADDVARSIFEHGEELATDLVALVTHGGGGLRDLLWGSLAQQVVRHGRQTVLLVPAQAAGVQAWQLRTVLVPVDGQTAHEPALPAARALAGAAGATLQLVLVIPTPGTLDAEQAASGLLLPGTTKIMLELAEEGSRDYLARLAGAEREAGGTVATQVLRGDVVLQLADAATRLEADLVVLATHGRRGIDAWLEGSVAPRLLSRVRCPLLLVRAGDE